MTLTELLAKIKEEQPIAETPVDNFPLETLRGRLGRKEQAVYRLKALKEAYEDELRRTAAFILVTGSARNEFTTLATENFKCYSADPEQFFSDLVNRLHPSVYLGTEGLHNIFNLLDSYLEEKMASLRVQEYNQLIYTSEYHRHFTTKEEFLSLVKQAIVNKVGGEVVGLQAAHTVTDSAIKNNNSARFTPIVLACKDERLALKLNQDLAKISNRVFLVTAGTLEHEPLFKDEELLKVEEANAVSVKKALKSISDAVKKF